MPKADSLTPENRFVALFIGPSGSGKTVAASSFPGPIENFDFDGRIRGILGAPWITPEMRKQINYYSFPPREEGMVVRLNQQLETMQTKANIGQLDTKTSVIDSLTSLCFAMVTQSLKFTHSNTGGDKKGKYVGVIPMTGPEDYGFEAQTTYSILSFFRSVLIPNVIVSAHIIDRYGKADPSDPFSESIVVGEKLSVRDKIGENIKIYFDHVFRFSKTFNGTIEKYYVEFRGDLARTSYNELPAGKHDITGKNFYDFLMSFIKKV